MRDELNTLDGYKTRLDELYGFIKKREEDIKKLEESEKKGVQLYSLPNQEVISNKYKAILEFKYIIFITTYSMGGDIKVMYEQYSLIVSLMKRSWKKSNGYIQLIGILSIGIMLEIEEKIFFQLAEIVKDDNPNDYLIDFLLHYRIPSWQISSDKFMFKNPYQVIKEIISKSQVDKKNGLERLKKYLSKEWYKGHSSAGWYDSHKHGIIHFGYWSFESGALVKILGLDDSSLKDTQYYPYDMVHWKF